MNRKEVSWPHNVLQTELWYKSFQIPSSEDEGASSFAGRARMETMYTPGAEPRAVYGLIFRNREDFSVFKGFSPRIQMLPTPTATDHGMKVAVLHDLDVIIAKPSFKFVRDGYMAVATTRLKRPSN